MKITKRIIQNLLYSKTIQIFARIVLGGIFIYAGIEKIFSLGTFSQIIQDLNILPGFTIKPFSIFLPLVELGLGILLLCGIFEKEVAYLMLFLLIIFIIVISIKLLLGNYTGCGCFSMKTSIVSPLKEGLQVIIRDIVLICLCLSIILPYKKSSKCV